MAKPYPHGHCGEVAKRECVRRYILGLDYFCTHEIPKINRHKLSYRSLPTYEKQHSILTNTTRQKTEDTRHNTEGLDQRCLQNEAASKRLITHIVAQLRSSFVTSECQVP